MAKIKLSKQLKLVVQISQYNNMIVNSPPDLTYQLEQQVQCTQTCKPNIITKSKWPRWSVCVCVSSLTPPGTVTGWGWSCVSWWCRDLLGQASSELCPCFINTLERTPNWSESKHVLPSSKAINRGKRQQFFFSFFIGFSSGFTGAQQCREVVSNAVISRTLSSSRSLVYVASISSVARKSGRREEATTFAHS